MINLPQTSTTVSEIQDMIHQKMKDFGIEKIHVSWNEDWIGNLQRLPEGPVRDAEIDKGLIGFLLMLISVQLGKGTTSLPEDDTPPVDPHVQEIINSTTL